MTEPTLIALLKTIGAYTVGPILAIFGWILKRVFTKIDTLEKHVAELDKDSAVHASQLQDIKEDVHQINKKLDKILDKLTDK